MQCKVFLDFTTSHYYYSHCGSCALYLSLLPVLKDVTVIMYVISLLRFHALNLIIGGTFYMQTFIIIIILLL